MRDDVRMILTTIGGVRSYGRRTDVVDGVNSVDTVVFRIERMTIIVTRCKEETSTRQGL